MIGFVNVPFVQNVNFFSVYCTNTIFEEICSYIESKGLGYHKLAGQGYDGAATFSGIHNGVQKLVRTHAAHALYIHCSCHRLQLASMQAAESIPVIKKVFGLRLNLWKIFYNSPKRAEAPVYP